MHFEVAVNEGDYYVTGAFYDPTPPESFAFGTIGYLDQVRPSL